jgi:serine/threonine protein phosphatase PrpC
MQLKSAGQTHVGMKRSQNQDNFLLLPEYQLFAVADGMGGHQGGETASKLSVETLGQFFRSQSLKSIPEAKAPDLLKKALAQANSAIQSMGQREPELMGMGTTTTSLLFCGNRAFVGQVGDSRAYLMHPGRIWQITRDHSLVQEKLRAGIIRRDQLKTDRMKNVITRSVGFEPDVEIDVYSVEVHPGDVFLLCSDGLTGLVEDTEILSLVEKRAFQSREGQLEKAVEDLIALANKRGGDDNVTALLIKLFE